MNETSAGLKKTLKRRHLFTLGVGTIVGVAWLMVLGTVLASAGPLGAAIGFVVGAVAMIPIGLCYAELAGVLPFAGGEIVYAYEFFGVRWAYVAGLCLAFIYIINCVFFAVSVGWLCNELVPGIRGPVLYSVLGSAVHAGDLTIGCGVSLALLGAHWRGARDAARVQDVATYTLLIATCVFVVIGIARGSAANLQPLLAPSNWGWGLGGILSALAVTPYFFGGFNTIPQATAELENETDRRRIASILSGCILVSLLFYCLVLAAVSMILPRAQVLSYELPVAQAFRVAFRSDVLADLVLVGGLLGLIAVWNALFFAASRVLFALGRSRLIHPSFGTIGADGGAPTRALVFVTALSMVGLFFGTGVLLPVVNVTSTLFALMYAIVCFAVIRHRRRIGRNAESAPGAHAAPGARADAGADGAGHYRVPGGPWLVWTAALFSLYLIVLSLVQQRMDAEGRFPAEWWLLMALGAAGWLLWGYTRASRRGVSETERRRIVMEDNAA
ncbi:MAG: family permease [Gammaproteobacteria bacterium]|nr:family permease [Gammaproteobacteria bacterium]